MIEEIHNLKEKLALERKIKSDSPSPNPIARFVRHTTV